MSAQLRREATFHFHILIMIANDTVKYKVKGIVRDSEGLEYLAVLRKNLEKEGPVFKNSL